METNNLENKIVNDPEVEYEDLSSGVLMEKPFNPAKIDITTKHLTIDLLIKRLKSKPIEIDLAPAFQRKSDLWDEQKKSMILRISVFRKIIHHNK